MFLLAACDDDASRSAPGVLPSSVAPAGASPAAPSVDAPSKASRDLDGARDAAEEGGSKASPTAEESDDPQTGQPGGKLVRGRGPAGHDAR